MPSASMNRLMDNSRVRLPGAIDTTIYAEMFSVVKEFCSDSNVWQQQFEFDAIARTTTPSQAPDDYTYTLYPPTGAKIVRIIGVVDPNDAPVRASLVEPDAVFLERAVNADATMRVLAVLTVTDPVARSGEPMAPDWLIEEFNDVLLDGILARMMSQAAKPYSSPATGAFHYGMFRSGVSRARIDVGRGNVYGRQNWSFPRSFIHHSRRG